jgi:hypothetical protein
MLLAPPHRGFVFEQLEILGNHGDLMKLPPLPLLPPFDLNGTIFINVHQFSRF